MNYADKAYIFITFSDQGPHAVIEPSAVTLIR